MNRDNHFPVKLIIFLLILFTIAASWYKHNEIRERILDQEADKLSQQLKLRESQLNREIAEARQKVRFLYSTPPVQGIVRASTNNGVDPYDGTELEQWKRRLEIIFTAYLENNPTVTQARYIGVANQGQELVRVNRNMGNIKVVKGANLQQKGGRDYFESISEQAPEQTHVSEINLNREFGVIVVPHEPTYRAGIPVYDNDLNLFGMVVINFDAKKMLRELQSELPEAVQVLLLNSRDELILHSDQDFNTQLQTIGLEQWKNLYQPVPGEHTRLNRILEQQTGTQYYSRETVISVSDTHNDSSMRLALLVPVSFVAHQLYQQSTQLFLVAGGALSLIIIFLVIYQMNIRKNLRLSEAQAQYEAIIEGSSDAIIGMDIMGNVTSWNASAQDVLGYSSRQAIGQPLDQLMILDGQLEQVENAIKQVAMGKYHEPLRLLLTKRNQAQLHVSMALSPIMLYAQKVVGVAAIIRDVTSQVKAEEEIQTINASLEQQVQERTKELEATRNEALSASRTKSNFIANVSHEIRTPLNGIIGMHNMLRKANTREQRERYLNLARTSAESLASLINDVLDLSKIEAGKLEIDTIDYNLMQVVSNVAGSMSIKAYEKGVELILDCADLDHSALIGDASRVNQILTNLISNAIKFTDTGWVRLSVKTKAIAQDKIDISIQVQDTGVGVAADKIDSIFDAFSQEDSSVTRQFGGTGLGLSITRQLCQLMGGNIECHSKKGEGSTFSCTLIHRLNQNAPQSKPLINLSGKRFLVLSPCEPIATSLAHQLKHWRAAHVECSASMQANTLTAALNQGEYDLALVDESLAEDTLPAHSATPIAVMTHHLQRLPPTAAGASRPFRLIKPVTPAELEKLLQNTGLAPRSDSPAEQRDSPMPSTDESGSSTTINLSGMDVLIVDDNKINQEVAVGLIEDSGATLHTADNGLEAIRALTANTFQLVLMDCQMPVMDGLTATQQIRSGIAGENAKTVPIVAMTASAMAGDRERCMAAGMDDYITKPLDPAELESKLVYWSHQIKRKKPIVAGGSTSKVKVAGAAAPDLNNYAVWDISALEKRVKHKQDRMLELIRIFKEFTPEKVKQLCAALQAGDLPLISSLAHSIKGSTGNIGAVRMQHLCHQIEVESKDKAGDSLQKYESLLLDEFQQLLEKMEAYDRMNRSA